MTNDSDNIQQDQKDEIDKAGRILKQTDEIILVRHGETRQLKNTKTNNINRQVTR